VFTRRVDLKLFLAFGALCLLLFGASVSAALFLNLLHRNVSKVLNENVRSTEAAERLEITIRELVRLLRPRGDGEMQVDPALISDQNAQARLRLADAEELANLPREKELVEDIAAGLQEYWQKWDGRSSRPPRSAPATEADLSAYLERRVLPQCVALRSFNLEQIVNSEQGNQAIVNQLLWGIVAVGMGGSLGGLVLGYTMARRLRSSIGQLSVSIRDAAGRLNRELGSVTLKEEGDLPALHRQMQGLLGEISRTVEQLQQREHEVLRAEQLAAVGQIAAGVAHELRNPLTAIKMLVQTGLEGQHPSGLPAEDLAVIEQSIRRLEQYIQIFLDFARPPRAERQQADLLEVVRRAAALVEGRARRQKVSVSLSLPDQPLPAYLDPEQIQQVLVNVLINALDVQPRGGTIDVAVTPAAGAATVEVRDRGPGLPAELRERLFEPFVTSKPDGVGLGLSGSKQLIEAHGGTMRIDDAPGGGAVVTITLPAEFRIQESGFRNQESGVKGQGGVPECC
jgi:signal transduction histidine kinase